MRFHSTYMQIFSLVLSLFFMACSSKKVSETPAPPDPNTEVQKKFEVALAHLEKEEYETAAQQFDAILVNNPASEFDLITLYNSGAAYEGLNQCKAAGRRYRQVAQTASARFPRIEAQALFRLSYAYECLGFPEKVVASLLDVYRRKNVLPDEIALAEVPARLAGAYAQVGQLETAKKFFREAEEGIKTLRRKHSDRQDLIDLLARTYFFMGRVQERQGNEVKAGPFFQSLRFLQTYLLKSVELESAIWSRRAADEILDTYRKMWELMEEGLARYSAESEGFKRKYILNWMELGLQSLAELKTLRFPGIQEGREARRMFSQLLEEERRMQEFFAKNAVSTSLTPEAEKREGLKREGKVRSVPTTLEKEALRRKQLPLKEESRE